MLRFDLRLTLFGKHELVIFQLCDPLLIGSYHSRIVAYDDAVEQAGDLLIDIVHAPVDLSLGRIRLALSLRPDIFEHCRDHGGQVARRLKPLKDIFEGGFHLVTVVGLAIAFAAFRLAEIVWISPTRGTRGPAAGHSVPALRASQRTT
ncbi:hypothetical protein [Roseivivax sp. THAF30]|uniref:hypothetical protein n=1 Tax=Roseivivax sp. THAF30 TaxID=2587852 RepID=UPI0020C818C4|nr:hypothetical protein [Roseivivax sp. THAF30]